MHSSYDDVRLEEQSLAGRQHRTSKVSKEAPSRQTPSSASAEMHKISGAGARLDEASLDGKDNRNSEAGKHTRSCGNAKPRIASGGNQGGAVRSPISLRRGVVAGGSGV